MLVDLYLLQTYFEEQFTSIHEEELVARFGRGAVSAAIAGGLLEHRRIPCGNRRQRCVCRLSEKGLRAARDSTVLH